MSLIVNCSKCSKKYRVGDDKAGKKIKCPGCGETIPIPAASDALFEVEADSWNVNSASDAIEPPLPDLPPRSSSQRTGSGKARASQRRNGMPKWLPVLLIVTGVIAGISVLACAGVYFFLRKAGTAVKNFETAVNNPNTPAGQPAPVNLPGVSWTKFSDNEAGFEVEFPNAKVKFEQTPNSRDFVAGIPGREISLRVSSATVGDKFPTIEDKRAALNLIKEGLVQQQKAEQLSSEDGLFADVHPEMKVTFKTSQYGGTRDVRIRYILVKGQLYQQIIVSRPGADVASEVNRFYSTFRLLKP